MIIFLAASILIDALVAIIIRRFPEKHYNLSRKFFIPSKKEVELYRKLHVQKWKDYVPELGGFTNMHKDKLANPYDNKYISKYIMEVCYGISIHVWSVPFTFLILFIDYKFFMGQSLLFLTMALPVALVNAILIGIPAIILRYNVPRLKIIYDFNKKKEENK